MTKSNARLKVVGDTEPVILEYKRGESAAEIAERLRKGIRRQPAYRSERDG